MTAGWETALGAVVTVLGSFLLYRGVKFTADRAKQGTERSADVDAQQSALEAWKELVEPYRREVAELRAELRAEREDRLTAERRDAKDREAAKAKVDAELDRLRERVDLLTIQLGEWKRLARTIARWATALRDEVLRLGGTVPATPEELLTLQAIEEAETSD